MNFPDDIDFYKIEMGLAIKPGGGSFSYNFRKIDDEKLYPKISYIMGFDEWGWIVGAGDYLDNLNSEIALVRNNLQEELKLHILTIVSVFIVVLIMLLVISHFVARSIRNQFNKFVSEYEQLATDINSIEKFENIRIHELKEIGIDIAKTKKTLFEANTIINRSSTVAFLWKNKTGWPVEYVSHNVDKLIGYSADEITSNDFKYIDLIHRDDLPNVNHEFETYGKDEALSHFTHQPYRIKSKTGNYIWVEDKTYIRRDSDNKITHHEGLIIDITKKVEAEQELMNAYSKIRDLKDRLQAENIFIKKHIEQNNLHVDIVGNSKQIKDVIAKAIQVAETDSTVLLLGETGTGKELFANGIHNSSSRKGNTLVAINCASIPEQLIESELFGHEKGAFTGADSKKIGLLEIANDSTIFLDEIGELPMSAQSKLLRVIENKEIQRLGGTKSIPINVRIIAATNQNLKNMINDGNFREDLFYRLNVYPINMPPLRIRRGDIKLLVEKFVEYFNGHMGKKVSIISKKDIDSLENYAWPGNVRELKNIIERAMIQSTGKKLVLNMPQQSTETTGAFVTHEEHEKQYIVKVLESTYWKVMGENGAAKILDMHPSTLKSKMKKLGIKRPSYKKN